MLLRGAECVPGDDVDVLIEDDHVPRVTDFLTANAPRDGVKIDVYGVRGHHGTTYHREAHLPVALGLRMLADRRPHACGACVPAPHDALLGLLYHAVYHKPEQSGLHWRDPEAGADTRYREELTRHLREAGVTLPLTLRDAHNLLVDAGFGVTPQRLTQYVQHDFRHRRKVYFHARLLDQPAGEMNLFVIRDVAVRTGWCQRLLDELHRHYDVVATNTVSWITRLRGVHRMRGGKWRRGGKPRLAVVVFDAAPSATSEAQRAQHPFVFNANQFIKQHWRERFVSGAGTSPKANPIHSTDNEAEAIGHLPLFFNPREQREIFERVAVLRGGSRDHIGRDEDA